MKKLLLSIIALAIGVSAASAATHTAHLVGDSTVCIWPTNVAPKMGWGQVFQGFFNSAGIAVNDKAISGTSSKSFYNSSTWAGVRNSLRAGDYVFIQFGHNDEKAGSGHTDPFTTYQQVLTSFINDTKAKGAFPILVTPVERNLWSNGRITASHGSYPEAMRQLAAAQRVPLIDLTALSTAKYQSLGQSFTTTRVFMNLSPGQFPNYPNGNKDNTHFQQNGATIIAQLVVGAIRSNSASQMRTLASFLK